MNEFSADDYPELYPMLHAHSATSVYEGIKKLLHDKKAMEEIGQRGREWFLTYCVQRPLSIIKTIIQEKMEEVRA